MRLVTSHPTNGVRVGVEESGNVVIVRDDASLKVLFTVTDVDGLIHALNMALVRANIEAERTRARP